MKQEDKELLLRDLCARLPYEVKGFWTPKHPESIRPRVRILTPSDLNIEDIVKFKPFLRPMSSMTDEEKMFVNGLIYNKDNIWISPIPTWVINESDVEKYIDFCHKHHLDWRGLIEKGLAIGTINGIYN